MKKKSKVQSPKSKVRNSKFKIEDRRPKTEDRPINSAIRNPQSAILFGVLPVLEALRAENRRIEKIFVADGAKEKRLFEILDLEILTRFNFVKFYIKFVSIIKKQAFDSQGKETCV